ncbi:MAG TPA: hypothetical protein VGN29_09140 [Solirubrobacteraceae bacterium]|nr:hypothetical protein [Solirubrobacteraceae bacterium]
MTVIADGVETFRPDHILLALHSSAHANWQEHGLVEHVKQRFGLPVRRSRSILKGTFSRRQTWDRAALAPVVPRSGAHTPREH